MSVSSNCSLSKKCSRHMLMLNVADLRTPTRHASMLGSSSTCSFRVRSQSHGVRPHLVGQSERLMPYHLRSTVQYPSLGYFLNLLNLGAIVGLLDSIVRPLQRKLQRKARRPIYPVRNKVVVSITAVIPPAR